MKHHKLHMMLIAMLGGAALAGTAFAHGDDSKFKSMDTNGDGQISSSEHAASVTAKFTSMDTDKDVFVTTTEMDTAHAAMKGGGDMKKMSSSDKIAKMDTDGDGKMSSAEYDAGAQKMFTEMDADKSGGLSMAEMNAGHRKADKDKTKDKSAMSDHSEHSGHDAPPASTPPSDANGG